MQTESAPVALSNAIAADVLSGQNYWICSPPVTAAGVARDGELTCAEAVVAEEDESLLLAFDGGSGGCVW